MDEDADKNAESVKIYEDIINKIIEILCVCPLMSFVFCTSLSVCQRKWPLHTEFLNRQISNA